MLKDKVVIVTGASSGIGKGCVEVLLHNNATVIGFDLQTSTMVNDRYRHYLVDIRNEANISDAITDVALKHS
jgi:NADP-dependent 3-hydroxy acid dehydrogenase YdfG